MNNDANPAPRPTNADYDAIIDRDPAIPAMMGELTEILDEMTQDFAERVAAQFAREQFGDSWIDHREFEDFLEIAQSRIILALSARIMRLS